MTTKNEATIQTTVAHAIRAKAGMSAEQAAIATDKISAVMRCLFAGNLRGASVLVDGVEAFVESVKPAPQTLRHVSGLVTFG